MRLSQFNDLQSVLLAAKVATKGDAFRVSVTRGELQLHQGHSRDKKAALVGTHKAGVKLLVANTCFQPEQVMAIACKWFLENMDPEDNVLGFTAEANSNDGTWSNVQVFFEAFLPLEVGTGPGAAGEIGFSLGGKEYHLPESDASRIDALSEPVSGDVSITT